MDWKTAWIAFAVAFAVIFGGDVIHLLVEKHDQGVFNWKAFRRNALISALISLAAFFAGLFHLGR